MSPRTQLRAPLLAASPTDSASEYGSDSAVSPSDEPQKSTSPMDAYNSVVSAVRPDAHDDALHEWHALPSDNGHHASVNGIGRSRGVSVVSINGVATDSGFGGGYMSRAKARTAVRIRLCGVNFHALMLFFLMLITFGLYVAYDLPGALELQLTAWFNEGRTDSTGASTGSYNHASNSLLYAIYSWPNCILSFFGGFFIDRVLGIRRAAIVFCALVLLGQVMFSVGCITRLFPLAVVGRFIFGLGGENLTVAQQTYTVRWFDGRSLALAFGLVVSFSRIGTALNFVLAPKLAGEGGSEEGIHIAMWSASGTCALSMVACLAAGWADRWGERRAEAHREAFVATLSERQQARLCKIEREAEAEHAEAQGDEQHDDDDASTTSEGAASLNGINNSTGSDIVSVAQPLHQKPKRRGSFITFWLKQMAAMTALPATAWVLFLITGFFYVGIGVFTQVASDMLQHTGARLSCSAAGNLLAIPNLLSLVGNPLSGMLLDRVGKAVYLIALACFMLLVSQGLFLALALGYLHCSPVWLVVFQGLVYSLGASTLWPILAFIVSKNDMGTAYGLMTSCQNMFLGGFSVLIGSLQDWARHHRPAGDMLQWTLPLMLFAGTAGVALLLSFVLLELDRRRSGGLLNASAAKRHARLDTEEADKAQRAAKGVCNDDADDLRRRKSSAKDAASSSSSSSHADGAGDSVLVHPRTALLSAEATSSSSFLLPAAFPSPLCGESTGTILAAARVHTPASLPKHAYGFSP